MHDLVIYGAGGLGREIAEIVRRINERHRIWNFLGFVDDTRSGPVSRQGSILGGIDFIKKYDAARSLDVVLGIGSPEAKKKLYETLKPLPHVHFPNVIDRDTTLSSEVAMEEGVVISHLCSISVLVSLGKCVFLNTGSHVGHDATLGDFCSVMSNVNISGNVTVGAETLIGAGVSILQGLSVGAHATVGMGAVVLGNVPEACTVLGNPARKF